MTRPLVGLILVLATNWVFVASFRISDVQFRNEEDDDLVPLQPTSMHRIPLIYHRVNPFGYAGKCYNSAPVQEWILHAFAYN
jgi:hypothetical protein